MAKYRVWLVNATKECKSQSLEAHSWQEAVDEAEKRSNGYGTWAVEKLENSPSFFKWAAVSTSNREENKND